MPKIYNVSSSNSFVETLANKLLQEYSNNELALAGVLILLPNRRACRSLTEAFVRQKGMSPTLLPQMRAIGDVKEDELILSGMNSAEEFLSLPPAINDLERTMLFMRLIMGRHQEFGLVEISPAQACYLAQELGNLIDNADMQELNWDNLKNIVPEEYASHWQETLKFLSIITTYWPSILSERGVIDAGKRKSILLYKQSELWQKNPPTQRIIIAGSTAVSPAMKELVKTVLSLPQGEVWLSGLDTLLEDEAWDMVDDTHPQFELKQLLEFLNISRHDVIPAVLPQNPQREKLISEIMRPAASTQKWQHLANNFDSVALSGINLTEYKDTRCEALGIAILIRQTLETEGKTIALITPDRTLARRVASELKRWNIVVDDSAGIPLAQTAWGIFMRLCLKASLQDADKVTILSLLKTELFACGYPLSQKQNLVSRLDKNLWRSALEDEAATEFLQKITEKAADLRRLLAQERASLPDLLKTHTRLAEDLSSTEQEAGSARLWQDDDGEAGAAFISSWLEEAATLGEISTEEYPSFFDAMMNGIMVRSKHKSHPRVKILGPIEARLNHYDTVILGEVTEGVWPLTISADPWMSRPMKKDFGFFLPERQVGVLGLDFSNLLGAKEVYLTHAKSKDSTPTIKSRWWMRLETILQSLGLPKEYLSSSPLSQWSEDIDKPQEFIKISAPSPKPPVYARPRKMSASAVEKLMRDPYNVFAEYILKLKPLDDLEAEMDMSDFGTLVHKILENFCRTYPHQYPKDAQSILLNMGEEAFTAQSVTTEKRAFWWPKYQKMVDWIVKNEEDYRHNIQNIYCETWGSMNIPNLPGSDFEIYAKADRIDKNIDGTLNIIDYKTGHTRSANEIKSGYYPQLPLEALIAASGGFDGIPAADVSSLMYWRLGDKVIAIDEETAEIMNNTKENLIRLINIFDFAETGYLSRPNPKHLDEYSKYEHLARVREWSVKDEDEGGE